MMMIMKMALVSILSFPMIEEKKVSLYFHLIKVANFLQDVLMFPAVEQRDVKSSLCFS